MHVIDSSARLIDNVDGLAIHYSQAITSDLLEGLSSERVASSHIREKDHMHVAEIPVALVDIWTRQGFDVFREDARSIVRRLREHNLEAFIATSKSV